MKKKLFQLLFITLFVIGCASSLSAEPQIPSILKENGVYEISTAVMTYKLKVIKIDMAGWLLVESELPSARGGLENHWINLDYIFSIKEKQAL